MPLWWSARTRGRRRRSRDYVKPTGGSTLRHSEPIDGCRRTRYEISGQPAVLITFRREGVEMRAVTGCTDQRSAQA